MDYCGPRGIRYAEFLEWDPLSRDAAISWQARANGTCGGCGTVRGDWLNTRDENGALAADELAPVYLTTDVFCAGCAAKSRHEKKDAAERPPGVHMAFVRNPGAASLEDEPEGEEGD
jgi:hypothetical protein